MNVEQKQVRRLALLLLDEPNGISEAAYEDLYSLMVVNSCSDLHEATCKRRGRVAFADEDFAANELSKLDIEDKSE